MWKKRIKNEKTEQLDRKKNFEEFYLRDVELW